VCLIFNVSPEFCVCDTVLSGPWRNWNDKTADIYCNFTEKIHQKVHRVNRSWIRGLVLDNNKITNKLLSNYRHRHRCDRIKQVRTFTSVSFTCGVQQGTVCSLLWRKYWNSPTYSKSHVSKTETKNGFVHKYFCDA
jgi:hypothetical protein